VWLLWEARGRWSALAGPATGLACGLLLAAPALLPAVVEKQETNQAWLREMPNGDFRINFIFPDDVLPTLGIKDPVKPPVLRSAHTQLVLAAVALVVVLVLAGSIRGGGGRRHDALAMAGGCALAYFMQLELSTPIWRVVPELATIQFPWRLQAIMVITAALLAGMALASWTESPRRPVSLAGAPAARRAGAMRGGEREPGGRHRLSEALRVRRRRGAEPRGRLVVRAGLHAGRAARIPRLPEDEDRSTASGVRLGAGDRRSGGVALVAPVA